MSRRTPTTIPPTTPATSAAARAHRTRRIDPEQPPRNPAELRLLLRNALDIRVPDKPIEDGSSPPMAYLAHSFFEGLRFPRSRREQTAATAITPATRESRAAADCVVWACRGGGKTFLGAIATMLDLVYKPGVQVRILGGSLEQSHRMQEHLRKLFERPALAALLSAARAGQSRRRLTLLNGSAAEVLAASETSVRGVRVQKIRCDEADLFDPAIWSAAQLTTRSMPCEGPWGPVVRGAVEALSTMHKPFGLMWDLTRPGRDAPVFRWGLVDVLARCPKAEPCQACNLWDDCRGMAKRRLAPGHVAIADARAMKVRVDPGTWAGEMLCREPGRRDLVYPEFDARAHVYGEGAAPQGADAGRPTVCRVMGIDFGFRDETVLLLARADDSGTLWVEREHVARHARLEAHVEVMRRWADELGGDRSIAWVAADPSGNAASRQTGKTDCDLLRAAGFKVRTPGSRIAEGIALVRERLGLDGRPPRLFIHARCVRLIECLRRYHYDSDNPRSRIPAKGEHDHACDALRYMVFAFDRAARARVGRW